MTGTWIRKRRTELGLSQAKLSKKLGLSTGAAGHWERKKSPSTPTKATQAKLLKLFDAKTNGMVAKVDASPSLDAPAKEYLEDRLSRLEGEVEKVKRAIREAYRALYE